MRADFVTDFDKLACDMGGLKEKEVLNAVREAVTAAPESAGAVIDALSRGMEIIGQKFDDLEYFIGDLIFAGEVFSQAMELLQPVFPKESSGTGKKVVLATVEGDVHDLGKNLVKNTLRAKGFEVIDLGVNVSPAQIVQRTIEENAGIVALSAVLTLALDSMQRTVAAFEAAGIRDRVTIIVGGACVNSAAARYIRADAYGETPEDTAEICLNAAV